MTTLYTKDGQVLNESQVRQRLARLSLPATLLPEHVAPYGFTVYILPPSPDPKPTIPQQITRLQAIASLYQAGQLPNVENIVNQAGGLTKLAWDNALTFDRNSPMLGAIATALNWPDEYIDQLFVAAEKIKF